MYKNAKKVEIPEPEKAHEFKKPIIILDEQKLPEQIIDVMKLSAMVCSEIKPAVPKHEIDMVDYKMAMPAANQTVAVA